jgi:hypothetical protein
MKLYKNRSSICIRREDDKDMKGSEGQGRKRANTTYLLVLARCDEVMQGQIVGLCGKEEEEEEDVKIVKSSGGQERKPRWCDLPVGAGDVWRKRKRRKRRKRRRRRVRKVVGDKREERADVTYLINKLMQTI